MSDKEGIHRNIRTLLNRVGNYTKCPACQTEMWWVTHKNGKKAPYSIEAVVHFNECSAAEGFGQPQKQRASNSGEGAPETPSPGARSPSPGPSTPRT